MSEKTIMLTVDGKRKLEEELEVLRIHRRQEIADRIQQAKQFGDITESGEYEDAKNEQAFIEGRIRELEQTLSHAHTIANGQADKSSVHIGCNVTILDEDENVSETWTVVCSAEADTNAFKISDESPLGAALMGKRVGDRLAIKAPSGEINFRVVEIN
jgi:transcription elongation factor GreA